MSFDIQVTTDMCECFEQTITTEKCRKCDKLRYRVNDELYPEHFGPYGVACSNTGQLGAGECWMCRMRREKKAAGEMQLIAGRYQYQFEVAMRCINSIDDLFEYRHKCMTVDELQKEVQKNLAVFTQAVSTPKQVKLKE